MQSLALLLLLLPAVVFAGYPAMVIAAAALAPRRRAGTQPLPASISIVVCAHNEAACIAEKIASVHAALATWSGAAELLVADDGSADDTAARAERAGARVIRCPRGGKAAALNRVLPMATGEVVVMTDADPLFDARTLPALLAPFADAGVGAVAGRVETLREGASARFARADRLYRSYESALRRAEDRLFGCVSADGGLYAIRRALVPEVPPDVTDDFHISTAAVAAGRRIAFAGDALAWERSIEGGRQQWRRRVRITVRGLTALWRRRALMNPWRHGWYALALVLHKLARRLVPLCLPPLWLLSGMLALAGAWWWWPVFAGLSLVAAVAVAGQTGIRLPRALRPLHGAGLHLMGLAAGTLLFLSGRRYAQWTPQKQAAA
jgi:cellulose synthase/poly-beta-1,6-N-acetylglucosamine synthase-like glycosyltransferase